MRGRHCANGWKTLNVDYSIFLYIIRLMMTQANISEFVFLSVLFITSKLLTMLSFHAVYSMFHVTACTMKEKYGVKKIAHYSI